MKAVCTMHHKQNGNILFLILIAVALFAALSYAVTGSTRTNSNGISKDKLKLTASQILQYGARLEQAFQRVRLINNCRISEISVEAPPFDGSDPDYVNASAPADYSCHIFHLNGGGVPYVTSFGERTAGVSYDSAFPVDQMGTTCADSSCSEIRLVVRLNTGSATAGEMEEARELCLLYNDMARSSASLGDLIQDDTWFKFNGTFDYRKTLGVDGGTTSLSGQETFCTRSNATPIYSINYVLLTR